MAAYKYPRIVEFALSLPRNASGKLMWRTLQTQQDQQDAQQRARPDL
jgi:acyl-coenzyme A synthetase/AMP-(fatty) acid ligase